jgi:hypothetical protein
MDVEEALNLTIACQKCRYNTKRFEIVGFTSGLFADYALVTLGGYVEKVNIDRIYDIREDEKHV